MVARVVSGIVGVLLASGCGGSPPPVAVSGPTPVASASSAPTGEEAPPPRHDGRLPDGARPSGYVVELTVDPAKKTFSGRVHAGIVLARASRFVVLHGRNLRIRAASLDGPGGTQVAQAMFRPAAHGKGEADELVLSVPKALPAGAASLDVEYDADFSEGLNGLYRVQKEGKDYAFTQFEPVGARFAFPCFDEPEAKVPFELGVTVPKGMIALSNMPAASESPSEGGTQTTIRFEKSPPLPSYLVALAVGPLSILEGKGGSVPIRLAAVAGRAASGELALRTAGEQLGVLEEYFGAKYPYPKLDLVAVPDFASGAMENAGLVTFREERLLMDERTAPTTLRRAQAAVIAHELSHMWFGDLVTMRWWDDIWLNEGFATWMATRVLDRWRPETRAAVEELGATTYAMHADTLDSARRVRQPVRSTTEALEAFDGITYVKGAALLGMVERWLGPDVFRKGVLAYLDEHRFGNATGEDLFAALSRASGEDVPSVFRTFTEQTGVPVVSVDACTFSDGRPVVRVRQREYRPLGASVAPGEKTWRFPVCLHFGSGVAGETPAQACTLLDRDESVVGFTGSECPRFVYPNADQAGYYRAKLPPGALPALSALPPGVLSARERVGLVTDAWALVESGELDAADFVDLARRFHGDREVAVWSQITSALERISDELVVDDARPAFEGIVRSVLGPEATALGWDAKRTDGDAERVKRKIVLSTLGAIGGDPAVRKKAAVLTKKWLAASASVDQEQASIAVPLVARAGDGALLDALVAKLEADPAPAERVIVLNALSAFSEAAPIHRVFDLVLDGRIRAQDQVYVYRGLFGRRESRQKAFAAASERIDALLARMPPFARRALVPLVARSCSAAETARAKSLIEPRLASLEGADRGFTQAIEEGTRCAAFHDRHAPKVAAWLVHAPPVGGAVVLRAHPK